VDDAALHTVHIFFKAVIQLTKLSRNNHWKMACDYLVVSVLTAFEKEKSGWQDETHRPPFLQKL
jgi:hypothetical protein